MDPYNIILVEICSSYTFVYRVMSTGEILVLNCEIRFELSQPGKASK